MNPMRFTVCLCLTTLVACDSGVDSSRASAFAIYRLQDATLTASQVWDQPHENLKLADIPFLTLEDLKSYKWPTHEFTVTATVDSQLAVLRRTLGPVGGIPFVVTVENERVYLGAFWYPYSSLIPQVPCINVVLDPHRISRWPGLQSQTDERNDPRIYRALKEAGILIE
jgi:hypothetical protein